MLKFGSGFVDVICEKVSSQEEIQTCFNIRNEVFVKEQNVPLHEELDGLDIDSEHWLLWFQAQPVGVARVRLIDGTAKIERVAILKTHRGKGLGMTIMEAILSDLRNNDIIINAKLSAQTYAIPFYEKLGFVICSDVYMDAGIPHQDMSNFHLDGKTSIVRG